MSEPGEGKIILLREAVSAWFVLSPGVTQVSVNKRKNKHWHRLGHAWVNLPEAGTPPSALGVAEGKTLLRRRWHVDYTE